MPLSIRSFTALLPAAFAWVGLGACTTVTVSNASVTSTSHFGVVVLKIEPGQDLASVVVTQGIGLIFGLRSATLGVLAETTFLAPDGLACRAFLIVSGPQEAAELRHALEQQPQLSRMCVINREPT
ncbi:hypothetical protein [Ideonella sp.]|uniref:hypothetical protein n=1 Tax=Ideonella sp. TaxID=1929293 RepID=UPI002B49480E|nr:hypothetical protein [Ideonella sp.]HJV67720.1 hypothetical protein [Ideonella sp.]